MGRIRSLGRMTKGNAVAALGGLVGLGALLGGGDAVRQAVTGEREARRREREAQLIALERKALEIRQREAAREEAIRINMRSLAINMPDLYNQASAGRALPKGATYIGGARRPDIIRDLAESMANGDFNEQG